jgi:hypothetical protein
MANRWRAWYADGRRFDSRTASVAQLPTEGLVIVMQYLDPPYKNIYHGEYIWHRGGKWGTAVAEFDARVYGDLVFPGALMSDAEWEAVQREAMESKWP